MFSRVITYFRCGSVEKLQVLHTLAGLIFFLLSIVISVITQYADSNFLLLAALGLFNLLYAPLVPAWSCSNRQNMQNIVSLLLLLAGLLQAVFVCVLLAAVAEPEEASLFYDTSAFAIALLLAATIIHLILHFGECLRSQPQTKVQEQATGEQQLAAGHIEQEYYQETPAPDAEREQGMVKWFNTSKGFGFIERDAGGDVFVHFRAIRGDGHRVLFEGERVEYVVVEHEKGLQANDVLVLE